MKRILLLLLIVSIASTTICSAQYWEGDHWYDNPLGFEPVKLHTSMGFILPALAVGATLLLTEKDTTLKNRISVYNESGVSWGYKYPNTFLAQNNTGIDILLRSWLSIGVDFNLYVPRDEYNNTIGLALRPYARFYAVNTEKWRLYFESGGGLIYFFENFPKPTIQDERVGTYLNGTTKYGIGSQINFSSQTSLLFGIRHLHISNGNTKGAERNPSHDSNGFYVGFSHRLND